MIILNNSTLPKQTLFKTKYSTEKSQDGLKSVPFMGLDIGTFDVEFRTDKEFMKCKLHHWYSMYGYAWELVKIYETGNL